MEIKRRLHIGLSLAPTWLSGDGWRRLDSDIENIYSDEFYLDIAKRAEAARLDFVFRPDTLFLDPHALETGPGFGSLDPTILLATMARETSHIGLLTTISTTFNSPYVVARQLQSLNWLSKGRVGWNIVTALDGNENFGLPAMPSAGERYERAAEFTQIVRRLWASYPQDALKQDRESGRYADSALVRPIDHVGARFSVKGPLNLPAYGTSSIPLIQAGASPTGRDFAASVADAIFASTPDMAAALELRSDLRQRALGHGRRADDIRVLPGLSLYLASNRSEARALFAQTHARADTGRRFKAIRDMTGLDLSHWPDDRRVTAADLPEVTPALRSRTHAELLLRLIRNEQPTVTELLTRPEVIGSAHWRVIGTAQDAAGQVRQWASAGAIDGFVILPGGSAEALRLALEDLVPQLTEAGLFRQTYRGSTFADHLRDDGGA
ncbi:monooxygenase [Labrys sp. WJW]|uniref:NtaA/DmoA family FMN-dependent monooxygenase n=1 Tax=Labrys sp. WJW TaxID=1737983 RepID=UPI000832487A|nr:NtaA/DmoA family FMN-dependent monooxygenase [Labrys sp. WJW]OCC02131.1 monooxygenase [Labrys sp. WJW]